MVGVRAVPTAEIATLMDANALTAMEYLDHAGGDAHIDLDADQRVRNRIEKVVSLDVIYPDSLRIRENFLAFCG
jgi:hypothetical protein